MVLSLPELKQEAYLQWETLLFERGVYNPYPMSFDLTEAQAERLPYANLAFRDEMHRYGDLRRRDAWEAAVIQLTAHGIAQGLLEPYQVLGYLVSPNYMNCPIRQHYGDQVIEAMLQFPEVLAMVRQGLEQVYQEDVCCQERELVEQFVASGKQLLGLGCDRRSTDSLQSLGAISGVRL